MLTLNEMTLYYYSISVNATAPAPKKQSALIKEWAAHVDSQRVATGRSRPSSRRSSATLASSTARSSTRKTETSSLTNNIQIVSLQSASANTNSNIISLDVTGGLADEDETHGNEREAAITSPPKGKVRVTSTVNLYLIFFLQISFNIFFQNLVKIEDTPVPKKVSKKRVFTNATLPAGCFDNDRYRGNFIPTFIWWASLQDNPWRLDVNNTITAQQHIWDGIYGKVIPYEITYEGAVYGNVSSIIM